MSDTERISRRAAITKKVSTTSYTENIDGRVHPELFLPIELFDALLFGLSPDTRRAQEAHKLWDAKISTFGYDTAEFWSVLRSATQSYGDLSAAKRHGRTSAFTIKGNDGKPILIHVDRDVCAARIVALQKARAALGGEDFDRFLYTVVAPDFSTGVSGVGENRRTELQFVAGGCK